MFACLFLVSLDGDAQIVVPDSLLNTSKSYAYNITSPDTHPYAESALRSAAYTYVIAALTSLATLLYYLMIYLSGRD